MNDFEEKVREKYLPLIANLIEGKESMPNGAPLPGSFGFECPAKNFDDFRLGFEHKKDGKCRLTFFVIVRDTGYKAMEYVFEAGDTVAEIAQWLRGPEAMPAVMSAMQDFDRRLDKGLRE